MANMKAITAPIHVGYHPSIIQSMKDIRPVAGMETSDFLPLVAIIIANMKTIVNRVDISRAALVTSTPSIEAATVIQLNHSIKITE